MAVIQPTLIDNLSTASEPLRRAWGGMLLAEGAADLARTGVLDPRALAVSLSGSTVNVASGLCVVGSAKGPYITGCDVTTPTPQTLAAADATYARIDRVILQVQDTAQDSSGQRQGILVLLTGTAAASPAMPAPAAGSIYIDLARIDVPKSGGGNPAVTDLRAYTAGAGAPTLVWNTGERDGLTQWPGRTVIRRDTWTTEVSDGTKWASPVTVRHAEFVNSGSFAVSGGQSWDIGPLSLGTPTYNNTFSNANGTLSGQINITENGLYIARIHVDNFSANPGNTMLKMIGNGSSQYAEISRIDGTPTAWEMTLVANLYLAAGDTIRGILWTTNNCNVRSRLAITKLQG
jgi:hypothetical protein